MLVCPVCKLEYSTKGDQQPRLLSCGHTFCGKCLDSQCLDGDKVVTCPQCSIVSKDPHVPNIAIMNYVEAHGSLSQPPIIHHVPAPIKALCQDCKKDIATLICFQCLASGFKFCKTCSEREHNRSFGPVRGHSPKNIEKVRISTPVPTCKDHPGKPCLFFSFKINSFACEQCGEVRNFVEDKYIPIERAVSQIREEVPSLVELLRTRVDIMSRTRSDLDALLGKVDQEKKRSMERVRMEFSALEIALKRRESEILEKIEEEARFQGKTLLQQQEKLEIAQGNADTAIVRANWLLQMSDYSHIHQAESVMETMKVQLADEEFPLYHSPASTGDIPLHLPEDFIREVAKLGRVGGGKTPMQFQCSVRGGLLYVCWDLSNDDVMEYEISYEPLEEKDSDPVSVVTSNYKRDFPRSLKQKGDQSEKLIHDIVPGKKYIFRIRALNVAGWGVWSLPALGHMGGFPLEIGYTGEIVNLEVPCDGEYSILAYGAKAADGMKKKGGRGAIIGASFKLKKYDKLIILCGGMSKRVESSSGGAGGTFVALNKQREILLVAGGGGGTRGYDDEDHDGTDANINSESGCDGTGMHWAHGGAGGGAGKDASYSSPSWGYGGAGFTTASTTAKSFLHGGTSGEGGGYGGGGAVGHYGGGGGGGYSGGGGGRGGGGGGSFIKPEGTNHIRDLGHNGPGMVKIDMVEQCM